MTIAEVLLQDFDIEISNTRRTLERVPALYGSSADEQWSPK